MFGESGGATIQRPNPPQCDEWGTLKRLGKEREVVGIYLSSHPLDDYKPIIDNICNATLSELNRLEENVGKELAFACVTISGEERTTADGKYQFGILVAEDYTDKFEFKLRRKDFERFRNFLHADYYLLIRGEVKTFTTFDKDDIHKLNPKTKPFFAINSMTQLDDVVDSIKQLTIYIDIDSVCSDFIQEFADAIKQSKGHTSLQVSFYDSSSDVGVNMLSKKAKLSFTDTVRDVLDKYHIKYTLK